jgi:hypothetical protein
MPGFNLTTVSWNISVVEIYSTPKSLVRLKDKNSSLYLKNNVPSIMPALYICTCRYINTPCTSKSQIIVSGFANIDLPQLWWKSQMILQKNFRHASVQINCDVTAINFFTIDNFLVSVFLSHFNFLSAFATRAQFCRNAYTKFMNKCGRFATFNESTSFLCPSFNNGILLKKQLKKCIKYNLRQALCRYLRIRFYK